MTRDERVRALLGNLKNWTWSVAPQFRIEQEDSDAIRSYVDELQREIYNLEQRIQDLEKRTFV
jgi:polyhydroxyalkanoate synthesis regulator phasin